MDELQSFDSLKSTGSLITKDRFGTKTVNFISWSEGSDSSLIEFTSAAEAGQKILRTSEELFLYFPDAEEVIRLQGAALRQSMLGSDISYEDMTDGKDTLDKYEVELLGEELVEGQNCYVIEMTAKSRKVPYPKQTVWVLKESFIPQKVEYFSKSGKLLKEMRVLEVMDMDDKMIISRMVLEDKLKKNSSTEMILETIEVDVSLPSNFFSLDQLSW
jgi:outer membrane lipoprotein-sorting protein